MLGDRWTDIYDIKFNFSKGLYGTRSCETICTFDIEASSGWRQKDGSVIGFNHFIYRHSQKYRDMIDNGEPVSIMYVWQMAVESGSEIKVFMGRTWEEFDEFLNMLTTEIRRQSVYGKKSVSRMCENAHAMKVKQNVDMKIWIHNFSYEFAFLRNLYNYEFAKFRGKDHVFARQSRKPMKAFFVMNKVKTEFRDTLVLVQKSLDNWTKDSNLPVKKLEVDKDFYLPIRLPNTELDDFEIEYAKHDVISMVYGLQEYRKKYGHLKDIPLTQTGEVRRRMRQLAKENPAWAKLCYNITTSYTPKEFKRLVNLFAGGWTHANKCYVGEIVKDVKCFDFASSYPFCICAFKHPLGKFQECNISEFKTLESQDLYDCDYRWYFKVKITNMKSKLDNSYWSSSKIAYDEENPISNQVLDNGRIYCCDHLITYMTDMDWDTFKKCYYYDEVEVMELYKSEASYFPVEMINLILDYFSYKTSLKGIAGNESLYCESKQFINSCYGVMVTRLITAIISFDKNGWGSAEPDDNTFAEMLHQTSEDNSFTEYQAGIWITSIARHNLFDFITKLDKRLLYADTDSIKGPFTDEDLKFIDDYNDKIVQIENKVAGILGIDPAKFTATTSKGKVKRLGIMEREDDCESFITLGAKRYCDVVNGEIECTVAGLPKKNAKAKIKRIEDFHDGVVWDTEESGKLIARYCDNMKPCTWKDRDGNIYRSDYKYGVCLQPTTFDLSMSDEFKHFLDLLQYGINRDDDFYNDTPKWFFN